MKSKDLKSEYDAKILVIGEDSNLVWSEEVPNYVMFADYYFKPILFAVYIMSHLIIIRICYPIDYCCI